jgi:hypothetical protein
MGSELEKEVNNQIGDARVSAFCTAIGSVHKGAAFACNAGVVFKKLADAADRELLIKIRKLYKTTGSISPSRSTRVCTPQTRRCRPRPIIGAEQSGATTGMRSGTPTRSSCSPRWYRTIISFGEWARSARSSRSRAGGTVIPARRGCALDSRPPGSCRRWSLGRCPDAIA